jgi:excisionase family DNA binding protein
MSLQGKNEIYFSTAEAARLLGIKETSIRMSVHRGSLVPIKIGQALVFSKSELDRYKREVKGKPGPKK